MVIAARSKDKLTKAVGEIKAAGGEAAMFVSDVGKEKDNKELAEFALSTYGAIHVAFLNAGIGDFSKIDEISEEQIDKVLGANLKSVIFGFKHLYPIMKDTANDVSKIYRLSSRAQ